MEQQQMVAPGEPSQVSTLSTRLANVFSSPSELYAEVGRAPVQKSSWVIPYILSLVLVVLAVYAVYQNPSLRQQVFDMQFAELQKGVEDGRLTQAQADRAREQIEGSGPVVFVLFGGVSRVVILSAMFFGAAFFLWLVAKFGLKTNMKYQKMLEVYGLASFIGVFGGIVGLLMVYALDSLVATPGASLLILDSFDRTNKLHMVLLSLNIFTLWQTAVVGIGLSKVSGRPAGVGVGLAFGLWGVWVIVSALAGLGLG